MGRFLIAILGIVVTLAVPAILAVNGIRVAANDRYVRAASEHGGLREDGHGLTKRERTALALDGLHSVTPSSEGSVRLSEARLADGSPAFTTRELRLVADVRTFIDRAYRFQVVALLAIAVLAVALGLTGSARWVVPLALRRGAILTIGLVVLSAVVWAARREWVATPLDALFGGANWRLAEADTLRRVYPDRLWLETAVVVGTIAILQAVLLYPLARAWERRSRSRQASRAYART